MKKLLTLLLCTAFVTATFASSDSTPSNGNNTNTNNVTGTNTNTNSVTGTNTNTNSNTNSNANNNTNSNVNKSNANATGGSVTGSGNSTNRITNTNRTTANGGAGGVGGTGGSSNVNVNNSSNTNTPSIASSAMAPTIFHSGGADSCMGSSSAAVQGLSLGIAMGSTWTDHHCEALRASVRLNELGLKKTAMARLCGIPEIATAFKLSGEFECTYEKK